MRKSNNNKLVALWWLMLVFMATSPCIVLCNKVVYIRKGVMGRDIDNKHFADQPTPFDA
ncbi:uncharacterized protein DS421_5g166930 [Arachis hypogaea]|nr:uncharacterized protein DS421_5g166930 [Arachis hypogaea]